MLTSAADCAAGPSTAADEVKPPELWQAAVAEDAADAGEALAVAVAAAGRRHGGHARRRPGRPEERRGRGEPVAWNKHVGFFSSRSTVRFNSRTRLVQHHIDRTLVILFRLIPNNES